MAEPQTPTSAATRRAERKADKARIALLERQLREEKKARRDAKWFSSERRSHDKKVREIEPELRKLKSKVRR
jgi:hypothetical protein